MYLNDFFFNNFYYFWTSFWYIPVSFLLLLIFTNSFFFWEFNKLLNILLACIFLIFFLKLIDYWSMNTLYNLFLKNNELLNILLVNSLNKYHPIVLYLTVVFYFSSLCITIELLVLKKLLWSPYSSLLKILPRKLLNSMLIIFTLFLGSWWALQEGSWGGWWNWDPSEVVGLFIMISVVFSIHLKPKNYSFSQKYLCILIYILIFIYVLTQLNFNLISHNFGLRPIKYFYNLNYFYWALLFVSILTIHKYTVSLRFTNKSLYLFIFFKNYQFYYKFILNIIIFLGVTTTINFIFNNMLGELMWKLLKIKITPFVINLDNLVVCFLVLCWLNFFKLTIYKLFLLFIVGCGFGYLYTLTLLYLFVINYKNLIHIPLYLFIFFTFFNKFYVFDFTNILYLDNFFFYTDLLLNFLTINFSIETNLIESTHLKFIDLQKKFIGMIVFIQNTTTELNEISMTLNTNNSLQWLLNGFFNKFFFTLIYDYQILNLLFLMLFFFINLVIFRNNKKLIIF